MPALVNVLSLQPITRNEARAFIARHHRHARPPAASVFQIGVVGADSELCGVLIGAIPVARKLMDGFTCEIRRVATDGSRNACSMLYGAGVRVAFGLGYRRIVTYTLVSESGASLRASGWELDPQVLDHDPTGWGNRQEARSLTHDLFGERTTPDESKRRWWKYCSGAAREEYAVTPEDRAREGIR